MPNRRRLLWIVPIVLVGRRRRLHRLAGLAGPGRPAGRRGQRHPAAGLPGRRGRRRARRGRRRPASRRRVAAADRTDGVWWAALTHVPVVGDDATGVRAMSRSLDTIARRRRPAALGQRAGLDHVLAGGRIDVDAVRGLAAAGRAGAPGLRVGGRRRLRAGQLRVRRAAEVALPALRRPWSTTPRVPWASAETATEVLPGDGRRRRPARLPAGLPEQRRDPRHRRHARLLGSAARRGRQARASSSRARPASSASGRPRSCR